MDFFQLFLISRFSYDFIFDTLRFGAFSDAPNVKHHTEAS